MIIVSACLAGKNCRFDGSSKPNSKILDLMKTEDILLVCPEELGGLPVPRTPSEIIGEHVISIDGLDRTKEFNTGAKLALKIALDSNCSNAILKSKSPSCGCGLIYDGTFTGKLIEGDGIFTKLLKKNKILVKTEKEI